MTDLLNLTSKEKSFLETMANVEGLDKGLEVSEVQKYKAEYGCDPCDACGPDACASCTGCIESYTSFGSINPFEKSSE
jgi:hypothetical protein